MPDLENYLEACVNESRSREGSCWMLPYFFLTSRAARSMLSPDGVSILSYNAYGRRLRLRHFS